MGGGGGGAGTNKSAQESSSSCGLTSSDVTTRVISEGQKNLSLTLPRQEIEHRVFEFEFRLSNHRATRMQKHHFPFLLGANGYQLFPLSNKPGVASESV